MDKKILYKPKSAKEFNQLNDLFKARGYVALMPGKARFVGLDSNKDKSTNQGASVASDMKQGVISNSPIFDAAFSFDNKDATEVISDENGKPLGLGYVKWGAGDNAPSVIPPLAWSLPYTAAPLNYIADLMCGMGVRLMYRFGPDDECEFRDAGRRLKEAWDKAKPSGEPLDTMAEDITLGVTRGATRPADEGVEETAKESAAEREARLAYQAWERTWFGYEEAGVHIPGAKEFLEENNLDLHMIGCAQDDVMLDIYFPTVGFQRGRRGEWRPKIVRVGQLESHSTRLERLNENRHINHVYYSDRWRTKGVGKVIEPNNNKVRMYDAAMPQHLLSDLRYIVDSNQKTRIKDRPTWVVCPTYYPSLLKPYYPQPSWWSIFPSKAFDYASTILYDKATARENGTSWGKIFYISLDYLKALFAEAGAEGDPDKQAEITNQLDDEIEEFLRKRENHGKMMRQWMWTGPNGQEQLNVKIVDITEATKDAVSAGKDELEMATNVIFLALRVDPRLVGVPMVSSSNGGTFQREMSLLKAIQMNPKQRLYLSFLNTIVRFNEWDEHAEFAIKRQVLTTLDASKTGIQEE